MSHVADGRILLVEDDIDQRTLVAEILRREGYAIVEAGSLESALAHLDTPVDLVVSDRKLGDGDAMDLLRALRARGIDAPFILVTAYGTISHAVAALKEGADDYLSKP